MARYSHIVRPVTLTKIASKTLTSLKAGERLPWPQIATALDQVDRKSAWRQDGAASFTNWLEQLAGDSGMGVAILWRSLSALRFYEHLRKDFPKLALMPVESIQKGITPDHLELLSKLSRVMSRAEFKAQLRAVLDGTVSRTQLRDTWRAFRPALGGRTARGRGQEIPRANPNDPQQFQSLLEARLYQTLATVGPVWTGFPDPEVYRLILGAAPVRIPGASERVVFDAVCVIQDRKHDPVLIEGIEFTGRGPHWQRKMAFLESLVPYCDYFWLVVPEPPSDEEMAAVPADIGVLVADDHEIRPLRLAQRPPYDAAKREALLMGLLVGEYRHQ
ncbi:MAG: hypothetical protein ACRETO_10360 [Gammaproteobacteria bacterium]